MMTDLRFDHAIIFVNDLEQAMADYRELGFNVFFGGAHANGITHNGLMCFADGAYLELLALTDPALLQSEAAQDPANLLNAFTKGEGYIGYALLADDIVEAAAALRQRGIETGKIDGGARKTADGAEIQWRNVMLTGTLAPFLLSDVTPRKLRVPDDPQTTTHPNGATGFKDITVAVEALDVGMSLYQSILGVTPMPSGSSSVSFTLPNCTLTLQAPDPDHDMQAYVSQRGRVPYEMTFHTSSSTHVGLLDVNKAHQARLRLSE